MSTNDNELLEKIVSINHLLCVLARWFFVVCTETMFEIRSEQSNAANHQDSQQLSRAAGLPQCCFGISDYLQWRAIVENIRICDGPANINDIF